MAKLNVWFDEKGDFLEISTGKKKGFFKDLGNGVFERVDKDGNTIGFAILNVSGRARRELKVPFEIEFSSKSVA